jgi:hypothetical protein
MRIKRIYLYIAHFDKRISRDELAIMWPTCVIKKVRRDWNHVFKCSIRYVLLDIHATCPELNATR